MFLVRTMNEIMTRLTKRDEVVGAISARLREFDMMHIQNAVFRFALAPLTYAITEAHIHQANGFQVSINLMLNGRCKPPITLLPVQETSLSVACLAIASCTSTLLARCQEFLDIGS